MDIKQDQSTVAIDEDQTAAATLNYGDPSSSNAATGKSAPRADALADYAVDKVGDYIRSAAKNIDRLADDLRDKKIGDLLSSATEYGRTHPVTMLAGAAVLGFALSRLIKAGVTDPGGHQQTSEASVDSTNVVSAADVEPMRDLA